jgi:hypothetical protein
MLTHTEVLSKKHSWCREEAGVASHRGCPEAADPERKDHPDLLGEVVAGDSTWRSW